MPTLKTFSTLLILLAVGYVQAQSRMPDLGRYPDPNFLPAAERDLSRDPTGLTQDGPNSSLGSAASLTSGRNVFVYDSSAAYIYGPSSGDLERLTERRYKVRGRARTECIIRRDPVGQIFNRSEITRHYNADTSYERITVASTRDGQYDPTNLRYDTSVTIYTTTAGRAAGESIQMFYYYPATANGSSAAVPGTVRGTLRRQDMNGMAQRVREFVYDSVRATTTDLRAERQTIVDVNGHEIFSSSEYRSRDATGQNAVY